MAPSILVIGPDAAALDRLAGVLAAGGFAPALAPTGRRALDLLAREAIALVLLDLDLPGEDGFGLLAELAAGPQSPPVVALLPRAGGIAATVLALELGAVDGVDADCDPRELVARLRRHTRAGGAPEPPRCGRWALHLDRRVADDGVRTVALSPLECRLLEHLIARRGATSSRDELVRRVWEPGAAGANVVDVCVRRVRRKLGADVVQTVRGAGYRLG